MIREVNNEAYGEILYSEETFSEYEDYYITNTKSTIRSVQYVYVSLMSLFFGALVIGYFNDALTFINSLPILIMVLLISIVFLFMYLWTIASLNWFVIYENGLIPPASPIKHVIHKKKFINFREFDKITAKKASLYKDKYAWIFRFELNGGSSFIINTTENEKTLLVLKYIMKNIDKKKTFTSEELEHIQLNS